MTIAIAGSGGGGGGPPTGPAGGDLAGTYPNPTLAAIGSATGPIGDATHVSQVTIDAKGRVTGLASVLITGGGAPTGPAGGDLAGTYPNPTLAAIGSATGPIGDATHVSQVTIDTKGRVTALASVAIPTSLPPNGAAGGDLGGTYPNPTLAAIGAATGPIGDATHVSQVTIDAKGRVTALASVAITGGGSLTVASGTLAADVVLVGGVDTTVMTTSSLAIGTWVLSVQADFLNAAVADVVGIKTILGTATATFNGPTTADATLPAAATGAAKLEVQVVVTVAGTIKINAQSPNADTVKRLGATYTTLVATGWTATKVA